MTKIIENIVETIKNQINKESIINYDVTEDFVLVYDEAYGVAKKRKKILKNPKTKTYSFFTTTIIKLFILVITNLSSYYYLYNHGSNSIVRFICFVTPLLYLLLAISIITFIVKIISRRNSLKGNFKLNKDGLTDNTFKGVKILFEWCRIKTIVVKKHSVIILTDTPIYFFVNKNLENKLIREIKKYKPDIIIKKED